MAHGARRRDRRGGIVIIVAISLAVLSGFVALSFDIGYARLMRTRLDMALEAASHAASLELDGTDDGVDNAISAAIAMAEKATIVGETLELSNDDVEFGIWDDNLRTFSSESDPTLINAVRVTADVTIPLFFGLIAFDEDTVGSLELNISQVATSGEDGGAYSTGYVLPFAIPDCYLDADGDDELDSGVHDMYFDAGGCATQYSSGYKQAFMATLGAFSNSKMSNTVSDPNWMGTVSVGQEVGVDIFLRVDNANMETSGGFYEALATEINSATTRMNDGRWSATPTQITRSNLTGGSWLHTLEGPIMVIDMDDDICTSGSPEAQQAASSPTGMSGTVIGFVWGAVYDIQKRCRNDSTGAMISPCTTVTSCSAALPAASTTKNLDRMGRIRLRVDTTAMETVGSTSGGPDWGVLAPGTIRLIPQ